MSSSTNADSVEEPSPLPPYEPNLVAAAAEVLLAMAVFYLLLRSATALFTHPAFLDRFHVRPSVGHDMACKAVSATFAVTASATGVYLMTSASPIRDSERTPPNTPSHPLLEHILLVVIAYFLYDLYAMFVAFASKSSEEGRGGSLVAFGRAQPLLVAHHLAIGVFLTPMMMFRLDHEPGELMIGVALIFEASTPFVSMRAILSHLDLKRTRLYVVNGLVMVVVFLCCRILVYPCFYCVYARQRDMVVWAALMSTPKKCLGFLSLVLAPQIYWFQVMVKGALKVVQDRREESASNGKKSE